jgi:methionyl-tRNA formyltransferase
VRLVFFGTPAFAVPTLTALAAAGHDIAAVYTRAPKPAGRRGLELTMSPVHTFAEAHGLAVRTPRSLRTPEAAADLAALAPQVGVVVGYGLILPADILAVPTFGCLNLHPSCLPRWRGAAPIQRPIIAGDTETAAAIMKMDEGLDTGPVALEERIPIPPEATAGDMHDLLASRGAALMVEALRRVETGQLRFTPQAGTGVVYAEKIDKAEARIDWRQPAASVHNLIRGLSPTPGAYFEADLGRGLERIKVLRATRRDSQGEPGQGAPIQAAPGEVLDDHLTIACGTDAVQITELQRAGKAPMPADVFLRGVRLEKGRRL